MASGIGEMKSKQRKKSAKINYSVTKIEIKRIDVTRKKNSGGVASKASGEGISCAKNEER